MTPLRSVEEMAKSVAQAGDFYTEAVEATYNPVTQVSLKEASSVVAGLGRAAEKPAASK